MVEVERCGRELKEEREVAAIDDATAEKRNNVVVKAFTSSPCEPINRLVVKEGIDTLCRHAADRKTSKYIEVGKSRSSHVHGST